VCYSESEMAERPPAPGELEVVRKFVNTLDVESHSDELKTPQRLRDWYVSHGLLDRTTRATKDDLHWALTVREAFRDVLEANHGYPVNQPALSTLNEALKQHPLTLQLEPGGMRLAPAGETGTDQALARLLAIAFRSIADGTWPRLKICKSDTCRWAFYDSSRNKSGNWCSMAVCGNRMKVRAYQRRARARDHVPSP
jgi:predicted RNA-binding Zn ribbon-like protein